jgi:hypothetical protein
MGNYHKFSGEKHLAEHLFSPLVKLTLSSEYKARDLGAWESSISNRLFFGLLSPFAFAQAFFSLDGHVPVLNFIPHTLDLFKYQGPENKT